MNILSSLWLMVCLGLLLRGLYFGIHYLFLWGFCCCQSYVIAEFRGVPFPTIKVKALTLETRILRSVVPGISRLLQTSPELKKIKLYTIKCNTKVVSLPWTFFIILPILQNSSKNPKEACPSLYLANLYMNDILYKPCGNLVFGF